MYKYKIMVVDDASDILDLLEKALQIEGFQDSVKIDTGTAAVKC